MLAAGLAVIAATISTRWQRAGLLAAVLLIGSSAQLALTQPIWFQRINVRPTDDFSYLLLLAVASQAFVTASVFLVGDNASSLWRAVRSLGLLKTSIFVVTALAFSFTAMRQIGDQNYIAILKQLTYAGSFLLLNLGSVIVLAQSLPNEAIANFSQRIKRAVSLPGMSEEIRPFDRVLPKAVALWTLCATVALCVFAFQATPHVDDEVGYLFQAKSLLLGQISVSAPFPVEAFDHNLIYAFGDKWFAITPPGWALILAAGVLVGLPWLVNPVLAATTILLCHAVFRRVASRGVANVTILLIALSPWFLATSSSLMNHTATLTLALAAWLALLSARTAGSALVAILSGAFMGLLFLTRPLEGVLIGTLAGLWCLSFLKDKTGWPIIIGYCIGCVAVGAFIFPFNVQLTGDPLQTPLNQYLAQVWHLGANAFGFGADIGPPSLWGGTDLYRGHSPSEALIHFQHNTHSLNFELFGWAIGSLSIFFAHVVWGRWSRLDFAMALIVAVIVGTYSLYWFSGSFYIGPRYWFMAFLPIVAITASGIRTVVSKLQSLQSVSLAGERLGFVLTVLAVLSMVSFMTWRGIGKYYEFRDYHADYGRMIEASDLNGALVFVRTTSDPDFSSAFVHNNPSLSGPGPVFARDLGPIKNRATAASFPGRPIYFVSGRSNAEGRARIVKGPVTLDSLP